MGLTKYEQEVIINFNAESGNATLYTANPVWIRKMNKLCEEYPDDIRRVEQTEVSCTYEFPKGLVHVGRPRKVTVSEERREQARQRMKNYHASKGVDA